MVLYNIQRILFIVIFHRYFNIICYSFYIGRQKRIKRVGILCIKNILFKTIGLGFLYNRSTISYQQRIAVIAGTGCGGGICAGTPQNKSFIYQGNKSVATWSLGSSPSANKLLYGQSFLGYYPKDHPAHDNEVGKYQRPALSLFRRS
jgi:hypothetical protein